MKRILTYSAAVMICMAANSQNSISSVLQSVEQNNIELKANERSVAAQRAEDSSTNNLPDPTISYAHLWNANDSKEKASEFIVSQSFDFPTLYASRAKLNKEKRAVYGKESEVLRQDILLQAKEICLDIIMLRRQQAILNERMSNAEELTKLYNKRMDAGDANILEINKLKLETLNVKTESTLNETALSNKLEELRLINGGTPISLDTDSYEQVAFPTDYASLKAEVLATDPALAAYSSRSTAAGTAVSVNRQGWLPKLELGYRRDKDTGIPFNGVVMGVSIPIFENRGKVKAAKAQRTSIDYLMDSALSTAEADLLKSYNEAAALRATIDDYNATLQSQQDISILKQALDGGQISIIDYFVEATIVYQSKMNSIELENRYQKLMAEIYKSKL